MDQQTQLEFDAPAERPFTILTLIIIFWLFFIGIYLVQAFFSRDDYGQPLLKGGIDPVIWVIIIALPAAIFIPVLIDWLLWKRRPQHYILDMEGIECSWTGTTKKKYCLWNEAEYFYLSNLGIIEKITNKLTKNKPTTTITLIGEKRKGLYYSNTIMEINIPMGLRDQVYPFIKKHVKEHSGPDE